MVKFRSASSCVLHCTVCMVAPPRVFVAGVFDGKRRVRVEKGGCVVEIEEIRHLPPNIHTASISPSGYAVLLLTGLRTNGVLVSSLCSWQAFPVMASRYFSGRCLSAIGGVLCMCS